MSKKQTQEQIFNRILINIAIAIVAYIVLYIFYAKFYLAPAIGCGVLFLVVSAVLFILSRKNKAFKNYAIMFLAFALALFFTRLSIFGAYILGFDRFLELINTSDFFRTIMSSRYNVIIVTWLGVIYLAVMLIYNTFKINKISKNR